jgi:hypothetical protein
MGGFVNYAFKMIGWSLLFSGIICKKLQTLDKGCFTMSGLDDLLPLIDNGGKRSHVERRRHADVNGVQERRSNEDRRKIADRRKVPNQMRQDGPERRIIFKKTISI